MMWFLLFSLLGEPNPAMSLKPLFELEFIARDVLLETIAKNRQGHVWRFRETNFSYDSARVGAGGSISKSYRAFLSFTDEASTARIIHLTEHKNPVAVAYAFKALKVRNPHLFEQRVAAFLKDQRPVETLRGCIGTEQTLGEVLQTIIDEPPVDIPNEIHNMLQRDLALERQVQRKQP